MIISSIFLAAAANAMLCLPQDPNAELASAYRSDVVGPEIWTGSGCGERYGSYKGTADSYLDNEVPSRLHPAPAPGLSGQLNAVNAVVGAKDVVRLEIAEGDRPLTFVPVRNHWTPSFMTTYYRSLPTGALADEGRHVGATVLKETKAILSNNTFVAEAVVKNAGPLPRTYRVRILTSAGLPPLDGKARPWRFTVDCRKIPVELDPFSAAGTTAAGAAGGVFALTVPGHGEASFRYGFSATPVSAADAEARLSAALAAADPFADNARAFNAWFERNVPRFDTGDPDLRRMWFYRWFVVKRNTHCAPRLSPKHLYPRTAVSESPVGGSYNAVVGLPVPLQIQEMIWMRDPADVRDHVLNWCDKVHGYDGYIQYTAMSVARLLRQHPDDAFARRALPALRDYALKSSGGDPASLPVQRGSWGVGAEYQPNFYQFTDPKWDARHDGHFGPKEGFAIATSHRLDTAVFGIGNLLGAAEVARRVGEKELAVRLERIADGQLGILRTRHWCEGQGLFFAADPATGRLADEAACYDSFAPYLWGLFGGRYLRAFDKFCDRAWFWDDFPFSTCSKTCVMYRGENVLMTPPIGSPEQPFCRGSCWNGPTWHFSNTLTAEAFGRAARAEPKWRTKWVEFFRAWTEMHALYGDRTSLRAGEDVRPEDGTRCGVTWDYFHSAWIDPFVRYWCGAEISETGVVTFEPFADSPFSLCGVMFRGHELSFVRYPDGTLEIGEAGGARTVRGRDRLQLNLD